MLFATLTLATLAFVFTPVTAIIRGALVTDDYNSYVVAIFQPTLANYGRSTTPFICSGVLITETSVITAQECVSGLGPSDIMIQSSTLLGLSQNSSVASIARYPGFNDEGLRGDIAVINLAANITNITPAILASPTLDNATPSGTVTLYGWGPTSSNVTQGIASRVNHAPVSVVDSASCASILSSCFSLDPARFCTSSNSTTGRAAYGDAGGAVVDSMGIVVGLITGNPTCAQPNNLAIELALSQPDVSNFINEYKTGPF